MTAGKIVTSVEDEWFEEWLTAMRGLAKLRDHASEGTFTLQGAAFRQDLSLLMPHARFRR
jgi:hypothetical protein